MIAHLLRDFLYLDVGVVESYLSAIQGALFEETIVEKHEKTGEGGGSISAGPLALGGKKGSLAGTEVTRKATLTSEAAFQRLYAALETDDSIRYFETFDQETWATVKRNSVLEVVGTLAFSKITQLTTTVEAFMPLVKVYEAVTGNSPVDAKAAEAIAGIRALGSAQAASNKGTPCIFESGGGSDFRLVAYLKPESLRVAYTQMAGEMTLFAKVLRTIGDSDEMELSKLLPDLSGLPLNREQRRKMGSSTATPHDLSDTIRGPAAIVVPIAIYQ